MFDSDPLAYTAIAASVSVSLIQICHWLLRANPRAVLNAGKWSLAGLIGLMPALLLWLVMSGRSTLALTLSASILPVMLWAAPRWHMLFGSQGLPGGNLQPDFSEPSAPVRTEQPDPELVRRSVIVLTSYLELATGQGAIKSVRRHSANRLLNGPDGGECRRMSIEDAFDILGLKAPVGPSQIREAHRRLQEKLKPELGDTHYLIAKIDEAHELLLNCGRSTERQAETYDGGV
jgi:hypothetical protein